MNRCDPRLVKRLRVFVSTSAVFSVVVGLSGLMGRTFHITSLLTWGAAPVLMKANAGACFVLLGVSLWLLAKKHTRSFPLARKVAANVLAAIVSLVGLLSLAQFLIRQDLGIDQFLMPVPPAMATAGVPAGLMSPVSAASFLLLGLALLGIDWRTRQGRWPAQFLALSAAAGATFGLIGFAFDPHIYAAHLPESLPTAVTFLVFSTALLCARPESGLGALLCSQSLGGSLARRLLPATLIPVLVGWARWQIGKSGLYSEWSIVVLSSLTTMSLLAVTIAWAAVVVDRNDVARRKAEEALQVNEEQLNRLLDRLDEPLTGILLRRKVFRGFVAVLLLAGLVAFLFWHTARREQQDADWVIHTQVVIKTLEATTVDLMDEEAGAHGLALSGHKPLLEPYETGRNATGQDLDALGRLTADNPNQQRRLQVLGPQVRAKIEASNRLVDGRRLGGPFPTPNQLVEDKQLLDAARTSIREMEDEEQRLLVERTRKTLAARRLTLSAMVAGLLVAIDLVIMAGFAIARQIGVSTRARAQVDALNASLEQRVEQRTAALQTEISERKQAEEARERLAAVVDSSDDAIISKTLDGTITAWNLGAERLFGYSSFQAVGKPMRLILPPGSANEEAEILSGIGNGQRAYHFDAVRVRNDGRSIDVSMTISPIKDSSGAIVGASSIARDITGRKRAESDLAAQAKELARFDQALQSQTVLLQCVLDNIGEGLAAADEHGRLFLWNPAAEKIIGLGMAILPTEQWTEHYGLFIPGTLKPFPLEQIPLTRAIQGQASTTVEILVRNPGRPEGVLIETNAQPLRDKNGALRGGVIAIRDITQRRKAEQSIQQLNEELEERVARRTAQLNEVNKELETFTYSVAHDLRAPLRHIAGFSAILLEEFGTSMDAPAQRYLERIREGAGKMGQLVDELLSLARVGRQETKMQQVDLNSIVEEVIGILRPDIQGRQVEWRIAKLPFVECDPTLVKLVFQNLISNALKYSRPRPLAVIEVGQTQEGAFFVRDNGVGFNMKYADKLFGVFQRLHRADEFEGIGVGLATVQRIIKKHRGSVWVEAELNQGATFYFTLGGPQPVETNATIAVESDQ